MNFIYLVSDTKRHLKVNKVIYLLAIFLENIYIRTIQVGLVCEVEEK